LDKILLSVLGIFGVGAGVNLGTNLVVETQGLTSSAPVTVTYDELEQLQRDNRLIVPSPIIETPSIVAPVPMAPPAPPASPPPTITEESAEMSITEEPETSSETMYSYTIPQSDTDIIQSQSENRITRNFSTKMAPMIDTTISPQKLNMDYQTVWGILQQRNISLTDFIEDTGITLNEDYSATLDGKVLSVGALRCYITGYVPNATYIRPNCGL
jgi:hypothetical protein